MNIGDSVKGYDMQLIDKCYRVFKNRLFFVSIDWAISEHAIYSPDFNM